MTPSSISPLRTVQSNEKKKQGTKTVVAVVRVGEAVVVVGAEVREAVVVGEVVEVVGVVLVEAAAAVARVVLQAPKTVTPKEKRTTGRRTRNKRKQEKGTTTAQPTRVAPTL
jgi:hypothetical protein